ncbi:MAG: beta-ketoacyl-[acyl-carrier-protein] synthase family protein [Sphingobacteriales bacterium]|nr:MAG: beta-ketoacyl-[acyl-carrier-protein] synthase family protein [Sphingobacteriales bacterium]
MSETAFVVNTGIITAIGNNTEKNLDSLVNLKTGISKAEFLDTHWRNDFPVGEIKLSNQQLADQLNIETEWPRTALLSAIAVKEAWKPFVESAKGLRIGFLSANTVGGMDLSEKAYADLKTGNIELNKFKNHECGAITELVAEHFGIDHFVTTISTACSSSANSIMMATQMIAAGMLDIAIAGGADSLSKFTLNGFNTLMILDKEPSRPFDNTRKGLNLGEGAGYVVLMSKKAMQQCNAESICCVSGYANANDAYHQTASSPEGKGNTLAIKNALNKAGLQPSDIDYINLHGTGTANNDSSEGKAIENIFGDKTPPASSTKTYTGHTLGAAGGVEAVYAALSIKEGIIFPNLRWQYAMDDISWQPTTQLQKGKNIKHVLSNSFGFGGNCSSIILSKS